MRRSRIRHSSAALVAVGLVFVAIVFSGGSAFAGTKAYQDVPPDQFGKIGYCNVNWGGVGATASLTSFNYHISCQVPQYVLNGASKPVIRSAKIFNLKFYSNGSPSQGGTQPTTSCVVLPSTTLPIGQMQVTGTSAYAGAGTPTGTVQATATLDIAYYSDASCASLLMDGTGPYINRTSVPTVGSSNTLYPAFPDNYWPGGSSGSDQPGACITQKPASVGSTASGAITVGLDASCSAGADEGATFAWSTTGGTLSATTGTAVQVKFTSDATYTVTVTETLNGVTSSLPFTIQIPTPSSSQPSEGGGTDGESGCGTDMLLHPSYIICWLKYLFVPSGTQFADTFTSLKNSATSKWPFGPLSWVGDQASGAETSIASGNAGGVTDSAFEGSTTDESGCHYFTVPSGGDSSDARTDFNIPLLPSNCERHDPLNGDVQPFGVVSTLLDGARHVTYTFSTIAIVVLLILGLRACVLRAMGDGDGGE